MSELVIVIAVFVGLVGGIVTAMTNKTVWRPKYNNKEIRKRKR